MTSKRRILVAVGGGIAAYKAAVLVSRLAQADYDVRVAMTEAAQEFIGRSTLAALSGHPVATSMFAPDAMPLGPHIELTDDLDLMVVAPATADLLARFACGLADNLVATLYLQRTCRVLIAPAMSTAMWEKAAVQRNLDTLREDGVAVVGPEEGWLSCRRRGAGRMAEPESIFAAIELSLDERARG